MVGLTSGMFLEVSRRKAEHFLVAFLLCRSEGALRKVLWQDYETAYMAEALRSLAASAAPFKILGHRN